jgi:1-acyl-sn-glycerol-3-phosphate acyltransferase
LRTPIYAVYGQLVLMASLILGFVVGTFGILPLAPLGRGVREPYAMVAAQVWARAVVQGLLATRVVVTGETGLRGGEGAVLFCNHRSWLDPLILMGETRSNGLSKLQILWIPFIGLYGWLAGAVFFDRSDSRSRALAREEVMRLVRSGSRIQVFPEATRSRDGRLRERVYLRLAFDAWNNGLPVVPCAIVGTERVLPPTQWVAFPGQLVRLDIHPALRPEDYDSARAFGQACWDKVKERLADLEALAEPEDDFDGYQASM